MIFENFHELTTSKPPAEIASPGTAFVSMTPEEIPLAPTGESALHSRPEPFSVSVEPREAPSETAHPTTSEISAALFSTFDERPDTQTMAALVRAGMTETDIIQAADHVPDLTLLRKDVDTITPYLKQLNEVIVNDYNDQLILYADRDADAMFDTHTVLSPHHPAVLLPASMDLLNNLSGSASLEVGDLEVGEAFLDAYGLTRERMRDPDFRAIVIDSGFHGSVLAILDELIHHVTGSSLVDRGQLDIRMVSTDRWAEDKLLTPLGGREAAFGPKHLPRLHHWLWDKGRSLAVKDGYSPTAKLAAAMQILPRYHGPYQNAAIIGREVILYTATGERVSQIDIPESTNEFFLPTNPDLVDRPAAAVTQYKVVAAALAAQARDR